MEETIHYFEETHRITVRENGQVIQSTEITLLCKALSGEADNRKKYVTCEVCNKLLRGRRARRVLSQT